MFFEGASSDFCEDVEHKSDKEIAKSLEKAYDSLKTIEHEGGQNDRTQTSQNSR